MSDYHWLQQLQEGEAHEVYANEKAYFVIREGGEYWLTIDWLFTAEEYATVEHAWRCSSPDAAWAEICEYHFK